MKYYRDETELKVTAEAGDTLDEIISFNESSSSCSSSSSSSKKTEFFTEDEFRI